MIKEPQVIYTRDIPAVLFSFATEYKNIMIDASLLEQLRAYFTKLQHPVVFKVNLDDSQAAKEMDTFLSEVAPLSPLLSYEK